MKNDPMEVVVLVAVAFHAAVPVVLTSQVIAVMLSEAAEAMYASPGPTLD